MVVESWCLAYFWYYLTQGGIGIGAAQGVVEQVKTSSDFFGFITGAAREGNVFGAGRLDMFVFWGITFALN